MSNSNIIHYSITGTALYGPRTQVLDGTAPEITIFGDAYISGNPTIESGYHTFRIICFSLVIGDFGYGGGEGYLKSNSGQTVIYLRGHGDRWGSYAWDTNQDYPNSLTRLPETYTFTSAWQRTAPDSGAVFGSGYFETKDHAYSCYIREFTLKRSSNYEQEISSPPGRPTGVRVEPIK